MGLGMGHLMSSVPVEEEWTFSDAPFNVVDVDVTGASPMWRLILNSASFEGKGQTGESVFTPEDQGPDIIYIDWPNAGIRDYEINFFSITGDAPTVLYSSGSPENAVENNWYSWLVADTHFQIHLNDGECTCLMQIRHRTTLDIVAQFQIHFVEV